MEATLPSTLTPLCFNRDDFGLETFSVDSFLGTTRGHVTLEQLKDDLHVFLKIIQNSMIELINKDYADFVNLSSNLVNLRPTIQKLQRDLGVLGTDFHAQTGKLICVFDGIMGKLEEKSIKRSRKLCLERRIEQFVTVQRLQTQLRVSDLASLGDVALLRLVRLVSPLHNHTISSALINPIISQIDQLLQPVLVKSLSYSEPGNSRTALLCLQLYASIQLLDSAHAHVIAGCIEPEIRSVLSNSSETHDRPTMLQTVLSGLSTVAARLLQHPGFIEHLLKKQNDPNIQEKDAENLQNFIIDCILMALANHIDENFTDVTIPSDSTAFHRCFSAIQRFPNDLTRGACNPCDHPTFLQVVAKFNFTVYYHLVSQELQTRLHKVLPEGTGQTELPYTLSPSDNSKRLTLFVVFDECLIYLWSDEVYLSQICARSWELTCQLLNRLLDWCTMYAKQQLAASRLKRSQSTTTPAVTKHGSIGTNKSDIDDTSAMNGHSSSRKHLVSLQMQNMTLMLLELSEYVRRLREFVGGHVTCRLATAGIERDTFLEVFERVVTEWSGQVEQLCTVFNECLINVLSRDMSERLLAVSEIPRQYRWTRKDRPTEPSMYLSLAFGIIQHFVDLCNPHENGLCYDISVATLTTVVSSYVDNITAVLESVDKMSSSLLKLRKSATRGSNLETEGKGDSFTDDEKIKEQLRLDVNEFCRQAKLIYPKDSSSLLSPLVSMSLGK